MEGGNERKRGNKDLDKKREEERKELKKRKFAFQKILTLMLCTNPFNFNWFNTAVIHSL